jgi:hypothetical protein
MNTVIVLGAGASRGYSGSRTGVHPPLANNFFSTFSSLMISRDLEVKIGNIVNYIRDTRNIPPELQPVDFDENIEVVFAELDTQLRRLWSSSIKGRPSSKIMAECFSLSKAYDQFIFWFAHVLNEIQNGETCTIYSRLVANLSSNDLILSFNWDTILDRVLYESGSWFPDDGYLVQFDGLLHNDWRSPRTTSSKHLLLKLHGSTNWLGPYVTRNLQTGERQWLAEKDTVNRHWCFVDGQVPFPSYKDRWRPGYSPFSYFFPPNEPILGAPLMPILIPPTDVKLFNEFASIFNPLWSEAHRRLMSAERLLIIGYSFPPTDTHALALLDSFVAHDGQKLVEIVDPFGDSLLERTKERLGNRAKVVLHKATLAEYLGLPNVKLKETETEVAKYDGNRAKLSQEMESTDSDIERLEYIENTLIFLSIHGQPFDMTTYSGNRFLDCKLVGEFAMHLEGAYRQETHAYRIANIAFKSGDNSEQSIDIKDIWIINPLPPKGISDDMLAAADLASAGTELRQMIKESFHCKDDGETDYFLRRFLAS